MTSAIFAITLSSDAFVVLVLVALHLIRQDISVWSSPISEYAIGRHGTWMSAALQVWGVGSIFFAVGICIASRSTVSLMIGCSLLIVFAIGLAVAAVFPMDLPFPPKRLHPSEFSTSGMMHISGATISTVCLPIGAVLISIGLYGDENWTQLQAPVFVLATACAISTLAFFATSYLSIQYFGMAQRAFVAADLIWQSSVAIGYLWIQQSY